MFCFVWQTVHIQRARYQIYLGKNVFKNIYGNFCSNIFVKKDLIMIFQKKKLLLKYVLEIAKYIWHTCFFAKCHGISSVKMRERKRREMGTGAGVGPVERREARARTMVEMFNR